MATQRREPGVETRCGAVDVEDTHIGWQEPSEPSHQRQELTIPCARRTWVRVRQRIGRNIDVSHLPCRVHTGVGASRRSHTTGVRNTVDNASSRTPATVRCPACTAQPANSVPS